MLIFLVRKIISLTSESFNSDEAEVNVVEANKVVEVEQVDLDAPVHTIEDVHGKIYIHASNISNKQYN